jgi:hypothetical protein
MPGHGAIRTAVAGAAPSAGQIDTAELAGSFCETPEGKPVEFVGATFDLTRETWEAFQPSELTVERV